MVTEGELRNNSLDDSDKVKELQDKVADLKAEVCYQIFNNKLRILNITNSWRAFTCRIILNYSLQYLIVVVKSYILY